MVEEDDADEQNDEGGPGAVGQVQRIEAAGAEVGVAKGLDQAGHGVGLDDPSVLFRDHGERIDDGGGIHGQLHAEGDEHLQIAVADGESGYDDAGAQPQRGHDEHQHGGEEHAGVGMDWRAMHVIPAHEAQKQCELDGEFDDVGQDHGNGDGQAREIDFAKDAGVVDEGAGGAGDALGEIIPAGDAGHVEQHGWQAIRGQLGNTAKDEGEQQGGEQRLDDMPQRAEDGLLVLGHKIAPDE